MFLPSLLMNILACIGRSLSRQDFWFHDEAKAADSRWTWRNHMSFFILSTLWYRYSCLLVEVCTLPACKYSVVFALAKVLAHATGSSRGRKQKPFRWAVGRWAEAEAVPGKMWGDAWPVTFFNLATCQLFFAAGSRKAMAALRDFFSAGERTCSAAQPWRHGLHTFIFGRCLNFSLQAIHVLPRNYIKATLHEAKILTQPLKSAAEMLLGDEQAGHEAVRAAVEAITGQFSRLETISLAPRLAKMFSSQAFQ